MEESKSRKYRLREWKKAKALGAIGRAGGFAVFPDRETGRKAIFGLLKMPDFQERTLGKALSTWAPAEDKNDVELYKRQVHEWTGLDLTRQVKSLSETELESLVKAIQRKEGWREGKIVEIPFRQTSKKTISAVRKNKKGTIIQYYVDSLGWLSKAEAISLFSMCLLPRM